MTEEKFLALKKGDWVIHSKKKGKFIGFIYKIDPRKIKDPAKPIYAFIRIGVSEIYASPDEIELLKKEGDNRFWIEKESYEKGLLLLNKINNVRRKSWMPDLNPQEWTLKDLEDEVRRLNL